MKFYISVQALYRFVEPGWICELQIVKFDVILKCIHSGKVT